jgi:hypothetical protein
LKHHLSDFVKFDFFDAQVAENDFAWPFVTSKHRFITFTKVVFLDAQKVGNEFPGPFAYLKHHLSEFVKVAFSIPMMQKMISYKLSTP